MLGMRFFACSGCETVYAGPEPPHRCDDCHSGSLEEISDKLRGDAYFTRSIETR